MDATTPPGGVTTSTAIGPNGTAPGLGFIDQRVQPRADASSEWAAGLPLLGAGVVLIVVFVTVFVRAARVRRRTSVDPLRRP